MNFRDKLSRLTAPVNRFGGDAAVRSPGASLEPELVPEPGEIVRVMEQLAASVGAENDSRVRPGSAEPARSVRPPRESETDEERAERIANLRSLIGDVLARGAVWRSPRAATQIGRSAVEFAALLPARDGFESSVSATARARSDARVRAATERARAAWAKAHASSDSSEGASIAIHESSNATVRSDPELIVVSAGDGIPAKHERVTASAPYFALPIATASADALRAALEGWIPARIRAPHPQSRLPWATRETSRGPVHVVERWLEPHHQHGNTAVRGAIDRLPATLAALALDPTLASLDLSRMLFLDTETTGLAGGSGTVAFLVGLASFDDASLRLEQLLVPNLGGEVPMLVALAERLAAASCMLTYNGKSFDWPLLRTRYVMNRLPVPALPPHVDLLHATRRIWKPRLGSLRLTEIERQIMRFFREDDLDGAEIPARYFSFLQDGGSEWLLPVLEHNQNDLIALPAMLGALGERFELVQCGDHALDALAFGKLALRAADPSRAEAFARAAIAASDGDPLAPQAWTFGGEVARRAGEMPAAIRQFEQALLLCEDPERSAALHVVLAKLYEHALRDFVRAYDHARFTELAEGAEVHGRRLGRLTRKLDRESVRLRARRA